MYRRHIIFSIINGFCRSVTFIFMFLASLLLPSVTYGDESYVPGQLIVKLHQPGIYPSGSEFGIDSLDRILAKYGIKSLKRPGTLPPPPDDSSSTARLFLLSFPTTVDLFTAMQEIGGDENVDYVCYNHYHHFQTGDPSDPRFGSQWGLCKIEAKKAWDIETGSEDVIIAMLETGIDLDHPDIAGLPPYTGGNLWYNTYEFSGVPASMMTATGT